MAAWGAKRDMEQGTAAEQPGDIGAVVSLMYSHIGAASPAWQKLEQLSQAYQARPGRGVPREAPAPGSGGPGRGGRPMMAR